MVLSKCNLKKKQNREQKQNSKVLISYKQVRLNVLLSWRVFILTDILQKDLNSR